MTRAILTFGTRHASFSHPPRVAGDVPLKAGEMRRKVEKAGWVYSHTTGSHAQYSHPTLPGVVTIPGADPIELAKGTEAN